jgi:hypothetical protein
MNFTRRSPDAIYRVDRNRVLTSPNAAGRWDIGMQHGPAPAAGSGRAYLFEGRAALDLARGLRAQLSLTILRAPGPGA